MAPKMLHNGDAERAQELVAAHLERHNLTVATAPLDDWAAVPHTDPMIFGGQIRQASGRATCRGCGELIPAGERALRFGYSFTLGGSFTATDVWLHLPACPGVPVRNLERVGA